MDDVFVISPYLTFVLAPLFTGKVIVYSTFQRDKNCVPCIESYMVLSCITDACLFCLNFRLLQLRVIFCFLLLGLGRALNVLVPYTYKLIGIIFFLSFASVNSISFITLTELCI